jgi:hypothetical protein
MLYRRAIIGEKDESIVIEPIGDLPQQINFKDLFKEDAIWVYFSHMEGETKIYSVSLPEYFRVKPPDLRIFNYDHKQIEDLIINCLKDNCVSELTFESRSRSLLNTLEHRLFVALQDLNSVLDLKSIKCNLETSGDVSVNVEFEHKNGERKVICVPFWLNE